MVELLFHIKLPIFVMRQHIRHRTASVNEYSGRYSVMSDEFYLPEHTREFGQSAVNKQMSKGYLSDQEIEDFLKWLDESYSISYNNYLKSLESGVSREISRIQLPVSNYTEVYWKIDLHNFFHYMSLRDDPDHAQSEIVKLAQTMYSLVKPHVPMACGAYEDYKKGSVTFSRIERIILNDIIDALYSEDEDSEQCWLSLRDAYKDDLSKREFDEFENKIKNLVETQ